MDYEIDNFVGVFHNAFSDEFCDACVSCYGDAQKLGKTRTRKDDGDRKSTKNDTRVGLRDFNFIGIDTPLDASFYSHFWNNVYSVYADKFSEALNDAMERHTIYDAQIQKTEPSEGYHVWHHEHAERGGAWRVMAFILYLNDVEEGGETEFLYLSKRVQPKKGTMVLFPSGYTHTHRGNPPLTNTKYILTGWIEL